MYHSITEPLTAVGSAIKEAEGEVPKSRIKGIIDKLTKAPVELLKEIGKEVTKQADSDVSSGIASKFIGLAALIATLAMAAGAQPAQVAKQISQADSSSKVEMILSDLLNKVDTPTLTMKGKSDISKVNQELNDKAFHFDTNVGPSKT